MAIATMRVPTVFTAVDKFSDVVSRMSGGVNRFSKTASSAVMRVDNKVNGLWGSLNNMSQLAIGGGVGGLFYYAGKDIMDYEAKIASLSAVTGTKVGAMNSQIESLGKKTKRSVIDIAGSFEIVGSKMSQYLDNPEALKKITNASILMADASRMELEPAIESLTGVMNIFGKSAEDALYIVNKLSAGEIVGSISIAQTADILRQFGGTARLANVQVDESVALIQTLTKSLGVEGVGRGIRNLMTDLNMVGAMDKNKVKALDKAGVSMDILGNKSLDLVTRLRELKKLEGNSAAMGMFFKKTGIQTGATLFQNFDDYIRFLEMIKKTNAAQEQADKNNATLARGIKYLKESFTNFIVTNNESNDALRITKNLLAWMTDNMGSIIKLIASITVAFLGWKVIVGVIGLINGIMAAFTAIMSVHRFVVLWATMTNVSYAASLWAVAAATLAAYWPLLLIAGALGLLVYSMWDTKDATEGMVSKQMSALDKGNGAWKNSTNVMSSELMKQNRLMTRNVPKSGTAPILTKGGVTDNAAQRELNKMDVNSANFDVKRFNTLQDQADQSSHQRFVKDILPTYSKKELAPKGKPVNLAGRNQDNTREMLSSLMTQRGGELVLNIKDKGNNLESVDDSNVKGIAVKTSSTKKGEPRGTHGY